MDVKACVVFPNPSGEHAGDGVARGAKPIKDPVAAGQRVPSVRQITNGKVGRNEDLMGLLGALVEGPISDE
jgi:hypothetical protein